jgi:hypothetical protein
MASAMRMATVSRGEHAQHTGGLKGRSTRAAMPGAVSLQVGRRVPVAGRALQCSAALRRGTVARASELDSVVVDSVEEAASPITEEAEVLPYRQWRVSRPSLIVGGFSVSSRLAGVRIGGHGTHWSGCCGHVQTQGAAEPTPEPIRDGSNGVLSPQDSADVANAWNRLLRWSRIRLRYAPTQHCISHSPMRDPKRTSALRFHLRKR